MIPKTVTEILNERTIIEEADRYLTRRERKQQKKKGKQKTTALPHLSWIEPQTPAQQKAFDAFERDKNLILHGVAGTGKTFIAMYLALEAILTGNAPMPIVVIRSVVPSRDIGFLPGKAEQKAAVYEAPYAGVISELVDKPYEWMKQNGYMEFHTTSFLRGTTFRDSIIIIDECQNMSDQEIHTIMTRVGEGCRVILCGDFAQKDYMKEGSGMPNLLKVAGRMKSFEIVKFNKEDVVRSGFVREYILTRTALDEAGLIT